MPAERISPVLYMSGGPASWSGCDDCCCQCDPLVLRPRRTERLPGAVEHFVRSRSQDGGRFSLDALSVICSDLPPALGGDLREDLAVHDRIGPALVWWPAQCGDVFGKVRWPSANGQS